MAALGCVRPKRDIAATGKTRSTRRKHCGPGSFGCEIRSTATHRAQVPHAVLWAIGVLPWQRDGADRPGLRGARSDRVRRRPLGIVPAARTLPTVALLLIDGVWADRLPRHVLLVAFSLAAAVTQAAAATLVISGTAHLWQPAVLEAVNGMAAAFLGPRVHRRGAADDRAAPHPARRRAAAPRHERRPGCRCRAGRCGRGGLRSRLGHRLRRRHPSWPHWCSSGRLALPRTGLPQVGVLPAVLPVRDVRGLPRHVTV